MRIDSLQYANGRMKEYDLFFATRILFSRILRAFFVYNNITHKKSRQINITMLFAGTLSLYNEL